MPNPIGLSKKPNELIPTRKSLLSRLKNADDDQSWREFFDTYWGLIYSVAIKSGLTAAEAQDVVQETVISAARNIKDFKYDPTKSFKGWLLQTTRWRVSDQFRKRLPVQQSRMARDDETSRTSTVERIPNSTGCDMDSMWEGEWREHIQEVALERLRKSVNPKHYQIFDAYAIKGWPVEKITAILRVTEDQVYKVKSRLAQRLRAETKRLEQNLL